MVAADWTSSGVVLGFGSVDVANDDVLNEAVEIDERAGDSSTTVGAVIKDSCGGGFAVECVLAKEVELNRALKLVSGNGRLGFTSFNLCLSVRNSCVSWGVMIGYVDGGSE